MVKENGMIMMTEKEYAELKEQIGKKVTRKEFLELYDAALKLIDCWDGSDETEKFNLIYGHNVTVHWNGIYCDCTDGATAWNHIVSNIESVDEEIDEIEGR